jgi:hypothetical protein
MLADLLNGVSMTAYHQRCLKEEEEEGAMTTTANTEKQFDHLLPEGARKAPPSGGSPCTDAQVKEVLALLRDRFALGR